MALFLLQVVIFLLCCWVQSSVNGIGVNWGTQSYYPLPPETAVQLLKDNGIQKVKLFDADYGALKALAHSGIQVTVGIPNDLLPTIASNKKAAEDWVYNNVVVHHIENNVDIRYVAVGNEPFLAAYNGTYIATTFLAVLNIQMALNRDGFGSGNVKIMVPHNADLYETSTGVPSGGNFRADIRNTMIQLTTFLNDNGSPFTVNIHPFLSLYADSDFPVEYAFFEGNGTPVVNDGGITYTNVFDANYDTLVWALQKNGFKDMGIIVGEIGWPTDGDRHANNEYAQRFMQGFMNRINKGTPMRTSVPIDAYLFSLVDEDDKNIQPGKFERHWGLFAYDGQQKYPLNLGGTTRAGALIPATHVKYLPKKWCVMKDSAKLDDPSIARSVSFACKVGDCSSLGYGTSCGDLDAKGNISYALNSYYQKANQAGSACNFSDLSIITNQDPSTGTCKFGIMIQPNYVGSGADRLIGGRFVAGVVMGMFLFWVF